MPSSYVPDIPPGTVRNPSVSDRGEFATEPDGLTIVARGDAHVADEHVRKSSDQGFPYNYSIRQGLSRKTGQFLQWMTRSPFLLSGNR